MDDAGAAAVGDVRVEQDAVAGVALGGDKVVEDGGVLEALQVPADVAALDGVLGLLLVHLHDARRGEHVERLRLGVADDDVFEVGVDTERQVAGEGPGRGGPREEADAGEAVIEEGEGDDDLWVRHLLVVLPRFEVGQRRAARCRHQPSDITTQACKTNGLAARRSTARVANQGALCLLHLWSKA